MTLNKISKIIIGVVIVLILLIVSFALINPNNTQDKTTESNNANNNEVIYGTQTESYTNNIDDYSELDYTQKPNVNYNSNNETNSQTKYECIIGNEYDIVQGEYTINAKMIAKNNGLCEVIATLTKAPGFEAFLIGSNATCYLTDNELNSLGPSTNISTLNCSGYLYEMAKLK